MANSVCLHHIRPEIESKKTEKKADKMKMPKCYEGAPLQGNMQFVFRKYCFFKDPNFPPKRHISPRQASFQNKKAEI